MDLAAIDMYVVYSLTRSVPADYRLQRASSIMTNYDDDGNPRKLKVVKLKAI